MTAEPIRQVSPVCEQNPAHEPRFVQTIRAALADIAAGRPVVVVDDEDRENEGDLIFAAESATPELLAFTIRYGSGVVCVAMEGPDLDRLDLPPMVAHNEDPKGTAYTVSVDAADGVTTGISAADRARTIRLLADPDADRTRFTRPGHVFPLRAKANGVLERGGHAEAAVDLTRLAGLRPAGAICEIVRDDGTMARRDDLEIFCRDHNLTLVSIADLARYRRRFEPLITSAPTRLPTRHGDFTIIGFREPGSTIEHAALVHGNVEASANVAVRVHSECLTGDVFGSRRCDCGDQLDASLAHIVERGRGVLVYLRGHEGRGIGLSNKLDAYALQDDGYDTVEANLRLGFPADLREYGAASRILEQLGVLSVRLMTNNPAKSHGLRVAGTAVTSTSPVRTPITPENLSYLTAKRDLMSHHLPGLPDRRLVTAQA